MLPPTETLTVPDSGGTAPSDGEERAPAPAEAPAVEEAGACAVDEALPEAAAAAVAAHATYCAWCLADVGRRQWSTASVRWMSGTRTGYGVVAWRGHLVALAAALAAGGRLTAAPARGAFAAAAAATAAAFAERYVALRPRRCLAAQWSADAGHAAETALSALVALGASLEEDAPGDAAALAAAARVLLYAVACFAAPAREVAAALSRDGPRDVPAADRSAGFSHGTVDLFNADPLAAVRDVGRTEAIPWATLLGLAALDRDATEALVSARPELVEDDFPPLDDAQRAAAGVLRAHIIHRRASNTSGVAAPEPPAAEGPERTPDLS